MNLWASRSRNGFTIVELLIVVVVIAILAAITLVSFNGVTKRAQSSATLASVKQSATAIDAYFVANNAYPLAAAGDTGVGVACLGEGYPSNSCGSSTGCGTDGPVLTSSYLDGKLKEFLKSSLPAVQFPPMTIAFGSCQQVMTGIRYTVGCRLMVGGGPGAYDPVVVGMAAGAPDCLGQAYQITYAVQGDVGACGISGADDLNEAYKYLTGNPDIIQSGWRVCNLHQGKVQGQP